MYEPETKIVIFDESIYELDEMQKAHDHWGGIVCCDTYRWVCTMCGATFKYKPTDQGPFYGTAGD